MVFTQEVSKYWTSELMHNFKFTIASVLQYQAAVDTAVHFWTEFELGAMKYWSISQ